MSSIIDALKKSDQNRNSDQQADVNNIQFSDNPPPKSRKGFWLLVIVLLLIAAGIYAWQQGWHHKLLSYFVENQPTATVEKANQAPQKVSEKTDKKAVARDNSLQQPAGHQLIPPKQSDIKAKTEQIRKEKQNNVLKEEPIKPVKIDTAAIKPLKQNHQDQQADNKSDNKSVKPEQNKKAAANMTATDRVNIEDKKSLEPTLKQDYLLLHQIDFAIRKNIPTVKINIHIYDPEPENRMVLINGERFNIGDSIENVLTVSDIVKEGIVVSFENIEFLIPK